VDDPQTDPNQDDRNTILDPSRCWCVVRGAWLIEVGLSGRRIVSSWGTADVNVNINVTTTASGPRPCVYNIIDPDCRRIPRSDRPKTVPLRVSHAHAEEEDICPSFCCVVCRASFDGRRMAGQMHHILTSLPQPALLSLAFPR
jgi:hypothetical protein